MPEPTVRYPLLTVDPNAKRVGSELGPALLVPTDSKVRLFRGVSQALAPWREQGAALEPEKIPLDLAIRVANGGDCLAGVALLVAAGRAGSVWADRVRPECVAVDRRLGRYAGSSAGGNQPVQSCCSSWSRRLARSDALDHQINVEHPVTIDLDATLITAHPKKGLAAPTLKQGLGFHPFGSWVDHGCEGIGDPLSMVLSKGNAGFNTAADHIQASKAA